MISLLVFLSVISTVTAANITECVPEVPNARDFLSGFCPYYGKGGQGIPVREGKAVCDYDNNAFEREALEFADNFASVDLNEITWQEIDFILEVWIRPYLQKADVVSNAIRRYEQCWLPLLASLDLSGDDTPLVPPLDVYWVWHSHMLNPFNYWNDSAHICGRVIGHNITTFTTPEADTTGEHFRRRSLSIRLWEQFCPNEPYDISEDQCPINFDPEYEQISLYDIDGAVFRQNRFHGRTMRKWLRNAFKTETVDEAVETIVDKYNKFGYLAKRYNIYFPLQPDTDYDLVWHAHCEFPFTYWSDTKRALGWFKNHSDKPDKAAEPKGLPDLADLMHGLFERHFPESR